jgi:3-deoxy-D-manno-octulosonate 8-phosphate phosphatase (KDO 8-P phosphatase)
VNYVNHKIDDSAALKELREVLKNKKMLILTPGKTLETQKSSIEAFIKQNDVVVISANFIPADYDVQFSFFSNQKRLERSIEFRGYRLKQARLIITSNVKTECRNLPAFMINYASLIKRKRWKYFDNTLILLIRLLYMADAGKIYIAGADGFSIDENYSNKDHFLETNVSREEGLFLNGEMKDMIRDILLTINKPDFLTFITPSLYTEKMNLGKITLIVLDVDGTMTDGGIYIDNNRVETKKFNIKDGAGILLAQSVGIEFMILTGRSSNCVEQRANELHIKYVIQGIHHKADYLKGFAADHNLLPEYIAYIGDDLNDLPAMRYAGVSACPIDAADEVKAYCDYILPQKGGDGVIRTFVELLLKEKKLWEKAVDNVFPIS